MPFPAVTFRYAIASLLLGIGFSALFAKALAPSGASGVPTPWLIAALVAAAAGAVLIWLTRR